MRVLVVEDDRALGNFVKKGLESEYHTVELAGDGQEALDWLESTEFDLLVLDLNLPKVDGMTVLSKMGPKKPCGGPRAVPGYGRGRLPG
jgi:DNA-binding response OmpR family regulator